MWFQLWIVKWGRITHGSLVGPSYLLPDPFFQWEFNWFPPSPHTGGRCSSHPLSPWSSHHPCDFKYNPPVSQITDYGPNLFVASHRNPLWPFKHFVPLLIVLHQSIQIQCYLSSKLPRVSPHFKWLFVCLETNWPCNRIYLASNYGLLNNLCLTGWHQSGPKGIKCASSIQAMKISALFHFWFESDSQV